MSGMLGTMLRDALGGQPGGSAGAIEGILQEVLSGGQGQGSGIGALISRFEQAGLGNKAQSWVTDAPNQPVSPDEVGSVFSPQEIQAWAERAGTTPDKMKAVLAQALPHVVDRATPNGQVPAGTPDIAGLLGKLL